MCWMLLGSGSRWKALSREKASHTAEALCFCPCIWAVLTGTAPAHLPGAGLLVSLLLRALGWLCITFLYLTYCYCLLFMPVSLPFPGHSGSPASALPLEYLYLPPPSLSQRLPHCFSWLSLGSCSHSEAQKMSFTPLYKLHAKNCSKLNADQMNELGIQCKKAKPS